MRLFILALLLHTAVSEYYKETQNFKFSRTSPEDGEKKGFYESQSGNMGGNYEHSRNMDTMAQRQFQDLRSQVGNQLGMDPLRMGAGAIENGGPTSVYGSASTSGTVKGGLLQDTQRSRNLDSAANRFDSNRGFYSSANDFGTQNSGMSHNSYNANYDDSQRTLGVADYTGTADSQRNINTDTLRTQHSGYNYADKASANRYVSSTRSQSSTAGLATDGTENIRYESGPYIPKSRIQGSTGSSSQNFQTASSRAWGSETDAHSGDIQGRTRVMVPIGGVQPVPINRQTEASGVQLGYSDSHYAGSSNVRIPESSYSTSHGTRFQHGSTTADELSESGSSRTYDNNEARTIRVQPGSKIKVVVRPNNPVKIQYPIKAQTQTEYSAGQGFGSQIYESQHGERMNAHNSVASQSSQSTGERRMGGYDTYIHRNQQSEAGLRSGVARESSVRPAGSLLSNTAQNRDRLLVGTLELDRENSESTRHLKGSETASTGTSYGESGYRQHGSTQSVDSTIGTGYTGATGANEANVNYLTTQPKSFQTSYSYHKSWERHGDPYQILPSGETVPLAQSSNGQNTNSKGDMEGSASAGRSRYIAGQQASSTPFANSGHSSNSNGYSSNLHQESMDDRLKAMQENLQNQMRQACPDCSGTKTKGYSASYSYSAQRRYGGEENSALGTDPSNNGYRSKRSIFDEYDSREIMPVRDYLTTMERDIEKIVDELLGEDHQWERTWSFDADSDYHVMDLSPLDYAFHSTDFRKFMTNPYYKKPYYVPYRERGIFDIITPILIYFEQTEGCPESEEVKDKGEEATEGTIIGTNEDPKTQVEDLRLPIYHVKEEIRMKEDDMEAKTYNDKLFREAENINVIQMRPSKHRRQLSSGGSNEENLDLGQQLENVYQQNTEYSHYTDQQSEDMGQQVQQPVYADQQTEEETGNHRRFYPQRGDLQLGSLKHEKETDNMKQTQNIRHDGQRIDSHIGMNIMQQNEFFGQKPTSGRSTTLDDFDVQRENVGQQTEDIGQQTEDIAQYGGQSLYPGLGLSSVIQENEFFGQKATNDFYGKDTNMQASNKDNIIKTTPDEVYKHHGKIEEEKVKENDHLQDILHILGGSNFNNDGHNTPSKIDIVKSERQKDKDIEQQNINTNWEQSIIEVVTKHNKKLEVADQIKATAESTTPQNEQINDKTWFNQESYLDTYVGLVDTNATENEEDALTNNNNLNTQIVNQKDTEMYDPDEDNGQQVQQNVWADLGQQTVQEKYFDDQQTLQQNQIDDGQQTLENMPVNSQLVIETLVAVEDKDKQQVETIRPTTTPKPGFWTRTKDKVKGWFN